MTRDQIIATYEQKLARIESSRSYSDHAKRILAAKAYTEHQAALEELRTSDAQQIRDRRASLQRHMFGHSDTSDPQALLARRGAADRANELDDPRVAQTAMQEALQQGDGILAQAIAKRAHDWGWGDVLGTYAAAKPHFARAVEEFNQLPNPDSSTYRQDQSWNYVLPTPSSLNTADTWEISRLAGQDLEDAA